MRDNNAGEGRSQIGALSPDIDAYFKAQGLIVHRVDNIEVFKNMSGV
jgi:hypothetical protein